MTFHERIIRDPAICGGQPVIRGTRVLARAISGRLAHGESIEAILQEFPSLTEEDVRAVLASPSMAGDLSAPAAPPPAADAAPPSAALSYDAEGVDRSLIRWMLRLTPRQRLDYVQGMIDLARSVRRIPHGHR